VSSQTFLHIIPHAFFGGTEKDCQYIIDEGNAFRHKVIVLGDDGPMVEQWKLIGAEVAILRILDCSSWTFVSGIRNSIGDIPCAGIFYWSTLKLPLVRFALRKFESKLIVHAGNPLDLNFGTRVKFNLVDRLFPSRIETAIFCCSEYVKKSLSRFSYFQKFEQRVSLNPVAIPENNCYLAKDLLKIKKCVIGMTARLDPIKDHRKVFGALKKILEKYPFVELWLLGDGGLRDSLKGLATKLGILDNIVFHGQVEDVYRKLRGLDIFIYATTPAEGLGNAVSEALASGLPCVVSDLPMMHEIGGANGAVRYCRSESDFSDAVCELIENAGYRTELSQKAFARANGTFSKVRYWHDRHSFVDGAQ